MAEPIEHPIKIEEEDGVVFAGSYSVENGVITVRYLGLKRENPTVSHGPPYDAEARMLLRELVESTRH